jgi:hypothetical protein
LHWKSLKSLIYKDILTTQEDGKCSNRALLTSSPKSRRQPEKKKRPVGALAVDSVLAVPNEALVAGARTVAGKVEDSTDDRPIDEDLTPFRCHPDGMGMSAFSTGFSAELSLVEQLWRWPISAHRSTPELLAGQGRGRGSCAMDFLEISRLFMRPESATQVACRLAATGSATKCCPWKSAHPVDSVPPLDAVDSVPVCGTQ